MKRSSGRSAFLRILACVAALIVAVGYFGNVRAQSTGNGPTIVIPLRPLVPLSTVPVPPVFGMEGILADKTAAIQLGKALFWDMQAGSDDRQACASRHFNAGADSRAINPDQSWAARRRQQLSGGRRAELSAEPGQSRCGLWWIS